MATTEITPKGSSKHVTVRNPPVVGVLDAVTLGIYGCYWYGMINRDLAVLGRARDTTELGTNPRNSFLALVPGMLLIVPAAISIWNTAGRIETAQRMAGIPEEETIDRVAGALLMGLLPPIGGWYAQKHLNQVWEIEAASDDASASSSNGTGTAQERDLTASRS